MESEIIEQANQSKNQSVEHLVSIYYILGGGVNFSAKNLSTNGRIFY